MGALVFRDTRARECMHVRPHVLFVKLSLSFLGRKKFLLQLLHLRMQRALMLLLLENNERSRHDTHVRDSGTGML